MRSYNNITIVGRLTTDPEKKTDNSPVNFSLAVNDDYNNKDGNKVERTHFIPVSVWGKQGEVVMNYCHKGKQILVAGKLMQQRWKDKETDENRSMLKVEAFTIQLLGSKSDSEGSAPTEESEEERTPTEDEIDPDDIPF